MRIPTTRASAKNRITPRRNTANAEESRLFKHILVPLDLSDRNERILRLAVGLARIMQSRVTLLQVIQGIAGGSTRELRNFYKGLEQRSRRTLARAAKRFVDVEVIVRPSLSSGIPPAGSSRRRRPDR